MISLITLIILSMENKINGDLDVGLLGLAFAEFLITAVVICECEFVNSKKEKTLCFLATL